MPEFGPDTVAPELEPAVELYAKILAKWDPDEWQNWLTGAEPVERCMGLTYEAVNPLGEAAEGFAIANVSPATGERVYSHEVTEEAIIVISGLGVVADGMGVRELGRGDSVIFPRTRMHTIKPVGSLVVAVVCLPRLEDPRDDCREVSTRHPGLSIMLSYFNSHPTLIAASQAEA